MGASGAVAVLALLPMSASALAKDAKPNDTQIAHIAARRT